MGTGQKPPDNKPPRIIEEIIAKYAVDANLFRLESTNPKKENRILSNESKKKIHDTHFIFPTTKGSMNACIELAEFSTSNKVKNHWYR